MPLVWTGNFAAVFQLQHPSGGKWAVKCFTRDITGLQERYQKLQAHLQGRNVPYCVRFLYLAQGILVNGQWFPVVKMEWVEGQRLDDFVEGLLDKRYGPRTLQAMAELWLRLAKSLEADQIAHGDLQHGNVLFIPGKKPNSVSLKLVDYDGTCVPALVEFPSTEAGHPNYQHPQRQYGMEMDRFSHLVIYTALRSLLAHGRNLWEKYNDGDSLLFHQRDFTAPQQSRLLRELWQSPDANVRNLVGHLVLALGQPPQATPPLRELLHDGTDAVRALSASEVALVNQLLGINRTILITGSGLGGLGPADELSPEATSGRETVLGSGPLRLDTATAASAPYGRLPAPLPPPSPPAGLPPNEAPWWATRVVRHSIATVQSAAAPSVAPAPGANVPTPKPANPPEPVHSSTAPNVVAASPQSASSPPPALRDTEASAYQAAIPIKTLLGPWALLLAVGTVGGGILGAVIGALLASIYGFLLFGVVFVILAGIIQAASESPSEDILPGVFLCGGLLGAVVGYLYWHQLSCGRFVGGVLGASSGFCTALAAGLVLWYRMSQQPPGAQILDEDTYAASLGATLLIPVLSVLLLGWLPAFYPGLVNKRPQIEIVRLQPDPPVVGQPLVVIVAASDPDGDAVRIQYRQEGIATWQEASDFQVRIAPVRPGRLVLEFRAVDDRGQPSDVATIEREVSLQVRRFTGHTNYVTSVAVSP
ncbi:MAG: hypothetical protein RMJ82_07920, partial [Gemmatales bacterium]|nr:hypothetical protein [Gemmatales bacterium]